MTGAVPGLPADEQPPQWYDLAIEMHRRNAELQSQHEARRQAEEAAKGAPKTAAGLLAAAIKGQSSTSKTMPLNGTAVVRAALAGGHGTINGDPT